MNEQIRHFSIIADHSALPKKTVDQDDVDLADQAVEMGINWEIA